MPPKITKVRWSASNLPWGLSFDENTGKFSGTPEDVGEYIVPVTVETNYGKDTKDVIINVVKSYPVYVIGSHAAQWSENAEPDEYGFRQLNIPNVYKLLNHYGGFGAKVLNGGYYCCGVVNDLGTASSLANCLTYSNIPTLLADVEETRLLYLQNVKTKLTTPNFAYQSQTLEAYVMAKKMSNGVLSFVYTKVYNVQIHTSGDKYTGWIAFALMGLSGCRFLDAPSPSVLNLAPDGEGLFALNDDGTKIYSLEHNGSSGGIVTKEIGYKVIKAFAGYGFSSYGRWVTIAPIFQYFSENKLLDNDASKFTLGIIRDVWVYQLKAYVVTEDNKLYEAKAAQGWITNTDYQYEWILQGIFDIKKMEVLSENDVFMLTNNGELYHKGSAVSGVTDEHSEFTRIFPDCYFYDMTFGGNTLTVLKE